VNQAAIGRARLAAQNVARHDATTPAEAVAALGAVQAQDYRAALWAIGARLQAATEHDVERALADGAVVRTWPLRGTLHFVAAADVRWLLELLAPRSIARSAGRRRQLGLDDAALANAREVVANVLHGGLRLSRREVLAALEEAGVSTADQRGYHLLWRLGQEGLLCQGPPLGREQAFVLLDDWVPPAPSRDRDEALAMLARRYFTGHGLATVRDFAWWSGLTLADARVGLAAAAAHLELTVLGGDEYWAAPGAGGGPPPPARAVHLLPAFDEYVLGYRDRDLMLDHRFAERLAPGSNGMFQPAVVAGGRIVGTWKRTITKRGVVVEARPFERLSETRLRGVSAAARRYAAFLEVPLLRDEHPA
jgi:hypothetical protein